MAEECMASPREWRSTLGMNIGGELYVRGLGLDDDAVAQTVEEIVSALIEREPPSHKSVCVVLTSSLHPFAYLAYICV